MISENLLLKYGAVLETYESFQNIFLEHSKAHFYFQIKTGAVKMYNLNESGKEFVQGFFYERESFGEPPLFADFDYPASALAIKKSVIYKLSKAKLFQLLTEHPQVHFKFTQALAERLFYKSTLLKGITGQAPDQRILTLIDFLKESDATAETPYKVPLTRQQIADMTGHRVETVIRAIKQLELDGKIQIIKRKVYR
ncbi:MAG: Crp/Fnr family transcriptional regulator [Bacteroidetes bacterium]|nr:Crp/Fnr family transcriptional regulator [Bacteroidota bacterium]